jgi:hypothetical protein
MKCPKCGKEMGVVNNQITNNSKSGKDYKEYDKTLFMCKDDDIWVSVETPKT